MEEIYLKDLMKSKITKKREQKWGVDSNGVPLVDKYTFSCRECDNAKRRTKACFLTNDEKSTKAELSTKALLAFKPMLVAGVGY